jgi:enolase
MKIKKLFANEILDSRGNPTLEVTCELESGDSGTASVPSGASTGIHEAVELRDGDMSRYSGLGVLDASKHVNEEISAWVAGAEHDQTTLDRSLINLDNTNNKSRLGANAMLGVSMSFARAAAKAKGIQLYELLAQISGDKNYELPLPMFNIINGGKHADSGLDIQEFMIVPIGIIGIEKQIQAASEINQALKKMLQEKGYTVGIGDEGGFAPHLKSNEEALELIQCAICFAGYTTKQIKIAIDVAASSLYKNKMCRLKIDGTEQCIESRELIQWYKNLVDKYPIISIEDGLPEDDWEGFRNLNNLLGGKINIVGDDLTATNVERIKKAKSEEAINSVLIKLNQIGTVTETIAAIKLTKEYGWKPFISHRSGETSDTFIADLSVALSCPFIKSGAPVRGERVAKYNRLLEIARLLKYPTNNH